MVQNWGSNGGLTLNLGGRSLRGVDVLQRVESRLEGTCSLAMRVGQVRTVS